MNNIATLTVNGIQFSIELPTYISDAIGNNFEKDEIVEVPSWQASEIASTLRSLIPLSVRPSTEKQLDYAERIASFLKLDLPENIIQSECCSQFIDKHQQAFREASKQQQEDLKYLKYLFRQTGRVSRWAKARNLIEKGTKIEDVAEEMDVKPNTIEKYLSELSAWELETADTEEYTVVNKLLIEYESGVNLYKKYLNY